MFLLSKEAARASKALLDADVKPAFISLIEDVEAGLVKQLNAGMSADQLLTTVAKIELLRNLKKFEQVIRTNAG